MAAKGEASIWQPRFATNLSANTKQVEEAMVAQEGQTEFLLETFTYAKDTGSLTVYLNGKIINKNEDWREMSPVSGNNNEADTFQLITPATAGDVITAVGLTEIKGTIDISASSIIAPYPPDLTVYLKATRWWDCRTGKSYVATENSTGYRQWVEERSPINPPNYEIQTLSTDMSELTIDGSFHSKLIEFTTDSNISVNVGRAVNAEGNFVGAIVFLQNVGAGLCTIVPDTVNGVIVQTPSSYTLEGQYAMAALVAKSENVWVLTGKLEVD